MNKTHTIFYDKGHRRFKIPVNLDLTHEECHEFIIWSKLLRLVERERVRAFTFTDNDLSEFRSYKIEKLRKETIENIINFEINLNDYIHPQGYIMKDRIIMDLFEEETGCKDLYGTVEYHPKFMDWFNIKLRKQTIENIINYDGK